MPKIRRNFGHWENTHAPGEADGEVLLSYVVMFHKMRLLDLYKTLKK